MFKGNAQFSLPSDDSHVDPARTAKKDMKDEPLPEKCTVTADWQLPDSNHRSTANFFTKYTGFNTGPIQSENKMPPVPANRSFESSNELQARLHELVPGGAHTYSRGLGSIPRVHGARVGAWPGLPRLGCRRQRVHRVRHGPAVGDARSRLPAGRRRGVLGDCRRGELQPTDGARAGCGRGLPGPRSGRRHGEVRQERVRRHHGRRPPGPRRDRPRQGRRLRAALLLHRRLVHRRHPNGQRHPGLKSGRDRSLPLQRPRVAVGGVGGRRRRLRHSRGRDRRPPNPNLAISKAFGELCDRHGALLDHRRDDHRVPLVRPRCADGL